MISKIVLLLAAYLFILALLPCADEKVCMSADIMSTEERDAHDADKEHEHEICSSLCACSCCGTITNVQDLVTFVFKIKEAYQSFKIPQVPHRFEGYSFSVWQPPKF